MASIDKDERHKSHKIHENGLIYYPRAIFILYESASSECVKCRVEISYLRSTISLHDTDIC